MQRRILKGEGDSTWNILTTPFTAETFLANQPLVKGMCEAAPAIIDLLDRMGVMFNRTPEGIAGFPAVWRNALSTHGFCGSDDGAAASLCAGRAGAAL